MVVVCGSEVHSMNFTHHDGKDAGTIVLYALSTCIWCKKTKELLNGLKVAYDFIDVDLASREEKHEVRLEMKKWAGKITYPFLIINNECCITGFDEEKIREITKDGNKRPQRG
jgi:glutaredoxin-like protein NrdH